MSEEYDEVEDLVSEAKRHAGPAEEPEELEPEESEQPEPARRAKKKRSSSKQRDADGPGREMTMEELEVASLLPKSHPSPTENVKTLGDIYARYGVGQNPDFRLHLYRTYPKVAPGGKKFDGFYDEWDIPLTLPEIQNQYGGGQYRVCVMGPHPNDPKLLKQYDSCSVGVAGDPNFDRLPRAQQTQRVDAAPAPTFGPHPMMMAPQESPKLAEAALRLMHEAVKAEREDKRHVEERAEQRAASNAGVVQPMIDAERRRADDLIAAEKRRADTEKAMLEERLREEREARREVERRVDTELRNRPSMGDEIKSLVEAGLFKSGDDGVAKEMLAKVLEKHQAEMSGVQEAHAKFLEQVRSGNEREIQAMREAHHREIEAMREAHRREIEAEREAGRARESRIEERLGAEREERRRDGDRYRESIADRDTTWKSRMDAALDSQRQGYESRIASLTESSESRVATMQARIDELRNDLADLKARQVDQGDILTQLSKLQELKRTINEFQDKPAEVAVTGAAASGSGGLQQIVETLADSPIAERIAERFFGGGGGGAPQPPSPPQYQEGQVVTTPQGLMEVVRDPRTGQLAFAPKEALDKYRASMAEQQRRGARGALPAGQGRRPRRKTRSAGISAVPNLAEGLPQRRPPWEGGDASPAQHPPAPPPPPPPPAVMQPPPVETQPIPQQMSGQEQQIAGIIAAAVHQAVSSADEPEDFVGQMLATQPRPLLKVVVGRYTDQQIAQAVRQVAPQSAGATPAGQQFIMQAFRLMRQALAS